MLILSNKLHKSLVIFPKEPKRYKTKTPSPSRGFLRNASVNLIAIKNSLIVFLETGVFHIPLGAWSLCFIQSCIIRSKSRNLSFNRIINQEQL